MCYQGKTYVVDLYMGWELPAAIGEGECECCRAGEQRLKGAAPILGDAYCISTAPLAAWLVQDVFFV